MLFLKSVMFTLCLFIRFSYSPMVVTCSLGSNLSYSLKLEKEDTGLDVIKLQNLKQVLILVAPSIEKSLKIRGMSRYTEVKMHLMTLGTREDRPGTA